MSLLTSAGQKQILYQEFNQFKHEYFFILQEYLSETKKRQKVTELKYTLIYILTQNLDLVRYFNYIYIYILYISTHILTIK